MPPNAAPIVVVAGDRLQATLPYLVWATQLSDYVAAATGSGTTAERPVSGLMWVGQMYYDTTLDLPVWVASLGPTVWVDATGAVV